MDVATCSAKVLAILARKIFSLNLVLVHFIASMLIYGLK